MWERFSFYGIAATGLGNYVASWVGVWSRSAGELQIFLGITIFCTLVGLLVIALLKPLERLSHGAEDNSLKLNTVSIKLNNVC
jgi:POT family proton-dependent oligopeptide transporter